jgi:hypothetical protein
VGGGKGALIVVIVILAAATIRDRAATSLIPLDPKKADVQELFLLGLCLDCHHKGHNLIREQQ